MSTMSNGGRRSLSVNRSHRSVVSTQSRTTHKPSITTDSRVLANRVREKASQPPSSPGLSDARKKRQYDKRTDPKPSPIHSYSSPHHNYSSSSSLKNPITGTSTHTPHDSPQTKRNSQSLHTQRVSNDNRYHHGALASSVLNKTPVLWNADKATLVDTSYFHSSQPSQPHTSYTSYTSYTGISSPSLKPRTSSISPTQSQTYSSYSTSFNNTTTADTAGVRHFHRGSYSVDNIPVAGMRTSPESSVSPLPQIPKRPSIDLVTAPLDSKVSSRKIVTVPSLFTSHSGLLGLYNSGNTVSILE